MPADKDTPIAVIILFISINHATELGQESKWM